MVERYWPEQSPDLLMQLLDDPDEDVQKTAQHCLVFDNNKTPMYAQPSPGRSVSLRVEAVGHLRAEPGSKHEELLHQYLSDPEPRVRAEAMLKLYGYAVKPNPDFVRPFLDDPSPKVQGVALSILSGIGNVDILEFTRSALLSTDPELRQQALWAASVIPDGRSLAIEQVACVELGVKEVSAADPSFEERRFPGLFDRCLNSKNPALRQLVSNYLGKHIVDRPFEVYIQLARDENEDVACPVIRRIGESKDKRAFTVLEELSKSSNSSVRVRVCYAMRDTKQEAAIPVLVELSTDRDSYVRHIAREALVSLKISLRKS